MRLEVRRASLDDDLRDLFEQYGEQVVAMALALGSNQGTGLRPSFPITTQCTGLRNTPPTPTSVSACVP
jgi:hypothetical protein